VQQRFAVGGVEVSVVCEGFASFPLDDEMPGERIDWAAERDRAPWAYPDELTWAWHVHAFAARMPAGVVMVDSGLGDFPPYRPWTESVDRDAALATAAIDPAEVVAVVHTHLHADHAGGAVVDGAARFPNAIHHAHPADWAFFGTPEEIDGYTARRPMQLLERLGMLDLTEDDHEVVPGVRVVHAPGHTPGHRVCVIDAGAGGSLVLTGDLLHLPVQIARPEAASSHDEDPDEGARSRVRVLADARDAGRWVGVSHFARPFGRLGAGGWTSAG
jgi:glyoxylase-like metal-dependent hydrolase (beta-lactamase superfamily II)